MPGIVEQSRSDDLRMKASHARRLAHGTADIEVSKNLLELAAELEAEATAMDES